MGTSVFIGLLVIAVVLFLAVQKNWISDKTLQRWANVTTVVALIAAAIVFVVPTATSPEPTSEPSSPELELPTTSSVPELTNISTETAIPPTPTSIETPTGAPTATPTDTLVPPTATPIPPTAPPPCSRLSNALTPALVRAYITRNQPRTRTWPQLPIGHSL